MPTGCIPIAIVAARNTYATIRRRSNRRICSGEYQRNVQRLRCSAATTSVAALSRRQPSATSYVSRAGLLRAAKGGALLGLDYFHEWPPARLAAGRWTARFRITDRTRI